MKKILYLLFITVLTVSYSCNSANSSSTAEKEGDSKPKGLAKLKGANSKCVFEKETYDLGKIQQGEIVKYTMKFTNEGEDLLVIKSARASCGCTVPKWTHEPLAKGEEGQLEVTFDSSGRSGVQHKSVMLLTNSTHKSVEVRFTAEIITAQ